MTIAESVRSMRATADISQEELSALTGISTQTIKQVERKEGYGISFRLLMKIYLALESAGAQRIDLYSLKLS